MQSNPCAFVNDIKTIEVTGRTQVRKYNINLHDLWNAGRLWPAFFPTKSRAPTLSALLYLVRGDQRRVVQRKITEAYILHDTESKK